MHKLKQFFIKNRYFLLAISVLLVFGMVILLSFTPNHIYYYWDQYIPLGIDKALKAYSYLWHNENGFGIYNTTSLNVFVYILFFKASSIFTNNIALIQRVFIYSMFSLSGIFCFIFLSNFYSIKKWKECFALLIASLFYMVNTFALIYIWRMNLNSIFIYTFIPFLFTSFHNYILEGRKPKYIFWLAICFIFLIPSFGHPAYLIVTWSLLFLYSAYISVVNKRLNALGSFFKILGIWLLLNIWWIFPMVSSSSATFETSGNASLADSLAIFYTTNKFTTIFNVMRLLGEWHLYDLHFGVLDFPWLSTYIQPSIVYYATFLIPALVLLSIVSTKKIKIIKNFFIILFILILFFITCLNNPARDFFVYLFNSFPIFRIFRNPYEKAGSLFVLSITFLIASFFYQIYNSKLHSRISNLIVIISAFILIIIIPYPFYRNSFFPSGSENTPTSQITVPDAYIKTAKFIESLNPQKIFVVPFKNSPLQSSKIDNQSYVGPDILANLTYAPIISTKSGIINTDSIATSINYMIEQKENKDFINRVLGLMGIDYIIQDPNLVVIDTNQTDDKSQLNLDNLFKKINTIANIDILQVEQSQLLKEINVSQKPSFLLNTGINDLINYLKFQPQTDGIFLQNYTNNNLISNYHISNTKLLDVSRDFTMENNQLNFSFDLQKLGNYQLLALIDHGNFVDKDYSDHIKINDKLIKNTLKIDNDILNLGSYWMNKESTLKLDINKIDLNISNNSFEDGSWECIDTTPANPGPPNFSCNKNIDSQDGNYSVALNSNNHRLGMRKRIDLEKDKIYNLTFYSKYLEGPIPKVLIESLNSRDEPISEQSYKLTQQNGWQKFNIQFRAFTEKVNLYFYADPGEYGDSKVLFDNVQISLLDTPIKYFLFKPDEAVSRNKNNRLEISYDKINPTKYKVTINNISESFFLNLMQSYDSNWKVYVLKKYGKTEISQDTHFMINGYANSWLVNKNDIPSDNINLVIEFNAQKKIYLITILSVSILVLISLIYYLNRTSIGKQKN